MSKKIVQKIACRTVCQSKNFRTMYCTSQCRRTNVCWVCKIIRAFKIISLVICKLLWLLFQCQWDQDLWAQKKVTLYNDEFLFRVLQICLFGDLQPFLLVIRRMNIGEGLCFSFGIKAYIVKCVSNVCVTARIWNIAICFNFSYIFAVILNYCLLCCLSLHNILF